MPLKVSTSLNKSRVLRGSAQNRKHAEFRAPCTFPSKVYREWNLEHTDLYGSITDTFSFRVAWVMSQLSTMLLSLGAGNVSFFAPLAWQFSFDQCSMSGISWQIRVLADWKASLWKEETPVAHNTKPVASSLMPWV